LTDKNTNIQNFKDQGTKIIPVKSFTKEPDVPDFAKYLSGEKVYDSDILPEQNYGVICGKISDNLTVIDVEKIHPDDYWSKKPKPRHIPLEDDFINLIFPDCKNETLTTKTGSENYHIIVKGEQIPSKTSKFVYVKDKQNIYQIDFKVTGHCVEAGSIHENGKPYEVVSNVLTIKRINLQSILVNLEKIGFKPVGKDANIETQDDFNTWTIDELLNGSWSRGERRRKQKSLYCKLRRNKESISQIKQKIIKINETLDDPLDKDELDYNFDVAEKYFQDVVLPRWGYSNNTAKSDNKKAIKEIINNFIKKYDVVTPFNTNDIYYRDGVIHKLGIDGTLKHEIKGMIMKTRDFNDLKFNIGIESQVPMNEPNPFDNDLIGLLNVVLDPNTFEPITVSVYVNSVLNRDYRPELLEMEDKILVAIKEILGDKYDKFLAICAVLLTGKNNIKKMIIFDGLPDSAKTTLLEILEAFVGDFTSQHIRRLQEDTRLLAKCNKRLNVTDEAENCILDEDIFKGIIDGSVRHESWKYDKELTTYDPSKVLHVGASNGIPDIRGEAGVAKRIERISCSNHFEKNDEWKKAIITKDNLDRFLLTVIEYAKSGVKNPLLDMTTAEKTELFDILGDPVQVFKEQCMFEEDEQWCLPDDVQKAFEIFRKKYGISKAFTSRKFSLALNIKSTPKRIDGKTVKVYMNWGLVGKSNTDQTIANM